MLKSVLFCHWIQLLMRSDSTLPRSRAKISARKQGAGMAI